MYPDSIPKKDQILKSANYIFAKYGFHKATLEDISKSLGMKKNSLYYYFPSKEALFEDVVRSNINENFEAVKSAIAGIDSSSEKLRTIFSVSNEYRRRQANLYNLTIDAIIDIHNTVHELYADLIGQSIELISNIIDEGIKSGEFKKVKSREVAAALIDFVDGMEIKGFREAKVRYLNEVDFSQSDKTIAVLFDLIIDGLKA